MDVQNHSLLLAPKPQTPDLFEAVYYSQPVPRSPQVLTIIALIFDRIYFPGVYMPPAGFDRKALADEIRRIVTIGHRDANTRQLVECLAFALDCHHVADFCVFAGAPGGVEGFEERTQEIVDDLEEIIFGPRAAEETVIRSVGPWIKGLPGMNSMEHQISAPDSLHYPANALAFASRNHLPLINDLQGLPVPGIPADPKANARLLATILAIESVSLVLPRVKPLEMAALKDFREELAPHVKPFRLDMLCLAKELNDAIASGAILSEVQKQARFLVETKIYPRLAELDAVIQNPMKHWYRRAVDLAKAAPELAANFATMPTNIAIAKCLAKIAGVLTDVRDDQVSKQQELTRSGLYYLLKVKEIDSKQ